MEGGAHEPPAQHARWAFGASAAQARSPACPTPPLHHHHTTTSRACLPRRCGPPAAGAARAQWRAPPAPPAAPPCPQTRRPRAHPESAPCPRPRCTRPPGWGWGGGGRVGAGAGGRAVPSGGQCWATCPPLQAPVFARLQHAPLHCLPERCMHLLRIHHAQDGQLSVRGTPQPHPLCNGVQAAARGTGGRGRAELGALAGGRLPVSRHARTCRPPPR